MSLYNIAFFQVIFFHLPGNKEFKRQPPSQQLHREHNIGSKKSNPNKRERYPKAHYSLSAQCQRSIWKNSKDLQSMWYQDNIHQQYDSSKISLPSQASNRIQLWLRNWSTPSYLVAVECIKVRHAAYKKVRLEEWQKAVCRGKIKKLGMTDNIWKERKKWPSLDHAKIIGNEEYWMIRRLKETVHVLGYCVK